MKDTYNYLTIAELNIFLHTAKKYEDITSYTFLLVLNNDGEPKITFHGLRHTHATILLNSGQNVKAIAQRLGNTPAMIYEIYGHVMKELEEQSVEVFSRSLECGTGASIGAN